MSRSACSARSARRRRCAANVRCSGGLIEDRGDLPSGSAVASARWRARSSAVGTIFASRACSDRRCAGVWRAATAELSSGCVNRRRSPSSSRIRAVERLGETDFEAATDGGSTRDTVGSAIAAAARATARPAALRPLMRSYKSSSRSEGIGSSSPGASVPPVRWSCAASSSAKKGLPREVSQSLISVGRGNVASRRASEQLVGRAEAQAADVDRLQSLFWHGAAKPRRQRRRGP